ncbi:MAG: HAMP domain-containing sensor histidine kinase [Pseudomonadota bacterium]
MIHRASLRTRLMVGLLGAMLVVAPITMVGVYQDAHHELDELFDAQLEQQARIHLAMDHPITHPPPAPLHPYTRKVVVRHLWRGSTGPVAWDSDPQPLAQITDQPVGFGTLHDEGGSWRYVGLWDTAHQHYVLLLQEHAIREELASDIALRVSLQSLILLPLLALFIFVLTTLSLRPLRQLIRALNHPDPLRVSLPPSTNLPAELAVVVEAFERLLTRFRSLVERERHFSAIAAHELRTPLAGLSAQLQLLKENHPDAAEDLDKAHQSTQHLHRLIERLLLLARLERQQIVLQKTRLDLHALLLEIAAQVQDRWLEREIHWDIPQEGDDDWWIEGDRLLLQVMLHNLLDNACKHGPPKLHIALHIQRTAQQDKALIIEDNGPGIPEERMPPLLQRFGRGDSDRAGLGLGLALAREIALLHGGTLHLGRAPHLGGLKVVFSLPCPDRQG